MVENKENLWKDINFSSSEYDFEARRKALDGIRRALDKGADPNVAFGLFLSNFFRGEKEAIPVAKLFVEKGADVMATYGRTPDNKEISMLDKVAYATYFPYDVVRAMIGSPTFKPEKVSDETYLLLLGDREKRLQHQSKEEREQEAFKTMEALIEKGVDIKKMLLPKSQHKGTLYPWYQEKTQQLYAEYLNRHMPERKAAKEAQPEREIKAGLLKAIKKHSTRHETRSDWVKAKELAPGAIEKIKQRKARG